MTVNNESLRARQDPSTRTSRQAAGLFRSFPVMLQPSVILDGSSPYLGQSRCNRGSDSSAGTGGAGDSRRRQIALHEDCPHHVFLICVSTATPPLGSRVTLTATRGEIWYCPWMVCPWVVVTLLEKVTNKLLVTRCCTVMLAPAGPWELLLASTGLMESCEIPATFEM